VPQFKHLFEPITIGNLKVGNRIALAPTAMGTCTMEGNVTDQNICHYAARARGEVGWITIEHTIAQNLYSLGMPRLLCLYDDRQVGEWAGLAEAIHRFGAKAIVQLSPGVGRQGSNRWDKKDLVAPSPIPYTVAAGSVPKQMKGLEGRRSSTPRELAADEVRRLVDLFVAAARIVKNAGFDGIEIHGAHGYLLAQFLSPLSNQRTDEYGRNFEGRMKLAKDLIRQTRKAVGQDFVLGFRISGDEHTEGGLTLDDTLRIVPLLVEEGLDFIHLSCGWNGALRWMFPEREGVILKEAEEVKKVSKVPVICPNFHDPETAEAALREGKVDMVSLSRALIADPLWAAKAKAGRPDEITKCVFCYRCLITFSSGVGTKCSVNPDVGWERFHMEL
jgi:2,4-dienoyl-CoA reductase-like NADH-dependent reductase (Old Yellow Enzyme family)